VASEAATVQGRRIMAFGFARAARVDSGPKLGDVGPRPPSTGLLDFGAHRTPNPPGRLMAIPLVPATFEPQDRVRWS
jgi:hypothetical protein